MYNEDCLYFHQLTMIIQGPTYVIVYKLINPATRVHIITYKVDPNVVHFSQI